MEYPEDRIIQRQLPRYRSVSRVFVLAVAAIALLLGFALGIFSASSTGNRVGGSPLYDEDLVTSLFEDSSPAVVELNVTQGAGILERTGSGSGFLVDENGHIVTNSHVVRGADAITVRLSDGRSIDATRLGSSPADDLALLQVDPSEVSGIKPLKLADSSKLRTGEMAVAIGSPFRNFNSVTVGVVSGTGRGPSSILRRPIPDMIQTDAPLNPGNSGGPLLNSRGGGNRRQLVGALGGPPGTRRVSHRIRRSEQHRQESNAPAPGVKGRAEAVARNKRRLGKLGPAELSRPPLWNLRYPCLREQSRPAGRPDPLRVATRHRHWGRDYRSRRCSCRLR